MNMTNQKNITSIAIDVAPGELIDKITILELKAQYIANPDKLKNVKVELAILINYYNELPINSELGSLKNDLKEINRQLWHIEDDIRICERDKRFDEAFIALARNVYQTNDKRAELKREINILLGSNIIEEKSYEAY
jgi:hypothetical protein